MEGGGEKKRNRPVSAFSALWNSGLQPSQVLEIKLAHGRGVVTVDLAENHFQ